MIDPDISKENPSAYDEKVKYSHRKVEFCSNNGITSYTELYSSNLTSDKDVEDCSTSVKVSATDLWKDRKSTSTASSNDNSNIAFSNSVSLLQDEFQSSLTMNGMD